MASLTTATALANQLHVPVTAGINLSCESTSRCVTAKLSVRRPSVSICHGQLSWTNSRDFGTTVYLFVPNKSHSWEAFHNISDQILLTADDIGQYAWPSKSASMAGLIQLQASSSQANSQIMAFTQEQSKLVKESWKLVQKDDPGKWALTFFLKVFEIAPSVKRMFTFLKDPKYPQIEKNPKLKVHALQVFALTGQAATQLGEKGGLDALIPRLIELGDTHVTYGVVDEHFDVVKFALLVTLGEALPEQWTPEMKEAWSTAYDELVSNIKAEMELVRARPVQDASLAK